MMKSKILLRNKCMSTDSLFCDLVTSRRKCTAILGIFSHYNSKRLGCKSAGLTHHATKRYIQYLSQRCENINVPKVHPYFVNFPSVGLEMALEDFVHRFKYNRRYEDKLANLLLGSCSILWDVPNYQKSKLALDFFLKLHALGAPIEQELVITLFKTYFEIMGPTKTSELIVSLYKEYGYFDILALKSLIVTTMKFREETFLKNRVENPLVH
eukprot:Pgem_evm2s377